MINSAGNKRLLRKAPNRQKKAPSRQKKVLKHPAENLPLRPKRVHSTANICWSRSFRLRTALKARFILTLNPHPAQGYNSEAIADAGSPDVVLSITKEAGAADDDFSQGIVAGNEEFHFQVKYASGALPEVRVSPEFKLDKEAVEKAAAPQPRDDGKPVQDPAKCVYCTLCARNCPMEALTVDRKAKTWELNEEACIGCGTCATACPKDAIIL